MPLRVRLPNPLAALDDRALLSRFAEGRDQFAFEQVVKRHGGLVYGVCRRAVRDRHLAEDAFQAVFLVLARNPAGALNATSVGAWLFGVARRVGLAARRREVRRGRREQFAMQEQGVNAPRPPQADFDDVLRVLDEELAALPEESRAVLVACFLQERTQDEAARELGWSLSTLRRRLERGKELLRARLARRGVTLSAGLLVGGIAAPVRAAVPPLAATPSGTSLALAASIGRGFGAKLLAAVAGAAALAAGGLAFGSGDTPPDEPPALSSVSQPAPAPQPAEAPKWGALTGRVLFPTGRAIPTPRAVPPGGIKDFDALQPFMPLKYENTLVDPKTRGIANAVVFLRPDSDDRDADFPAGSVPARLANAGAADRTVTASAGQFAPRVLAVRAGDRVTFANRLPVPTNVNCSSPQEGGTLFNVLVGQGAAHTARPWAPTLVPDVYSSTIHPWMRGYVWAFDHPHFAVTDAEGRFEIRNAPVGKWRLVAWHESAGFRGAAAGRTGAKVTIDGAGGNCELEPLVFESTNWGE